jgi:uncharacterized protein
MGPVADDFDLAGLRLAPGEGRRLELSTRIEPLQLGSERYEAAPQPVPVMLDVSRLLGGGYALRLSFSAAISGPCMRCLKPAEPTVDVEAREVDQPGAAGGERDPELDSPYVHDETLDLSGWAHDAFALAMPLKVLCREDCRGLCPECAVDLNEAGPDHRHERAPDRRWEKLRELRLH